MAKKRTKLFIQLYFDFYDTKEWRSLKWYSKLAYLRFKRKYNPRHSEKITVSYKEMTDEMSEPTFKKAIQELEEVGFIDIEQKGGLYRKRNYYSFSHRWRMKGLLPLPQTGGAMVDIHKAKICLVSNSR